MTGKIVCIVIALFSPTALSVKLADGSTPKMALAIAGADHSIGFTAMEEAFARPESVRHASMELMSKNMTLPKAMMVLKQGNLGNHSVYEELEGMLGGTSNLRAKGKGFGGLDGARKLLNGMIFESMTKYDAEIEKCVDYYAKQCAVMEIARGDIFEANEKASSARALISDAQYNINECEKALPQTKLELEQHNAKCKTELTKLDTHLQTVLNDIEILTAILEMSDCDAPGLIHMDQVQLLRCKNRCTNKDTLSFNNKGLQDNVDKVQSAEARELIFETFADLFDEDDATSVGAAEFVQVNGSEYKALMQFGQDASPTAPPQPDEHGCKPDAGESWCELTSKCIKAGETCPQGHVTKFKNPPLPQTKVPNNPCNDPNQGAPGTNAKRAAKCTLKKSPRCYKLQARFLQIQAGVADMRDELKFKIEEMKDSCTETRTTLKTAIDDDQALLSSSQTKLARATEAEQTAGKKGRSVNKENTQMEAELKKQMKSCTQNYIDFESEICALKKIRGDLHKKFQKGHSGLFKDCELTAWVPGPCSVSCAKGTQQLTRTVIQHPDKGTKCLPKMIVRDCKVRPCPVHCELLEWGGWSKCSSPCGGGTSTRVRDLKTAPRYNGEPCPDMSESRQCNVEACEKHCVLSAWTEWSRCSKDCDGGTQKRNKFVKEPAEGEGTCAGEWQPERLQYRKCNSDSCMTLSPNVSKKCNETLDVILLLDGTPKSGAEGFKHEQKAANLLLDGFVMDGADPKKVPANFAVIYYNGPRTWSGVSKCTGEVSDTPVDTEKDCHVKIAQDFTESVTEAKAAVDGLKYQPGTKLLTLGLMSVEAELPAGRPHAKTVVVVFIDGEPLSYRNTKLTARKIRKKARLLWVPVGEFLALKNLKEWATRRWQENLVKVAEASDWSKPETATHIMANICPKPPPPPTTTAAPTTTFVPLK